MRWHYTVAAHSDVGTTKNVNQDSLTVKVANTIYGEAAFAVICDGMGGWSRERSRALPWCTRMNNGF